MSRPIGQELDEFAEQHELKNLARFDNGHRNVFNKVRPVVTPEDMAA